MDKQFFHEDQIKINQDLGSPGWCLSGINCPHSSLISSSTCPTLSHSIIVTSASSDVPGTILPQSFCIGWSLGLEFLSQRRIPFLHISPSWDGFLWPLYIKLPTTMHTKHTHTPPTYLCICIYIHSRTNLHTCFLIYIYFPPFKIHTY